MDRPTNDSVTHRITGVVFKCDVPNANGRVYSREVVEKAIQDYKTKRSMVGGLLEERDLSHPINPIISLGKLTHIITDLHMEDNGNVYATAQFLTTPHAKDVGARVYDAAATSNPYHLVPTGRGIIGKDGRITDYELWSIDVTSGPSAFESASFDE